MANMHDQSAFAQALITKQLKTFAEAIEAEVKSGYEIDQTLDRKCEEGFTDGLLHLALALGLVDGYFDTAAFEARIRDAAEAAVNCDHNLHGTTAHVGESIVEPIENRCTNCGTVVSRTL